MTRRSTLRIFLIPALLAVAAFCAYGVLATLEPGSPMALRIVYGTGLITSLIACPVIWFMTANTKS